MANAVVGYDPAAIKKMFSDYVMSADGKNRHTMEANQELGLYSAFTAGAFRTDSRLQDALYERMMSCAVEFEESGFIAGFGIGFRCALSLVQSPTSPVRPDLTIIPPVGEMMLHEPLQNHKDAEPASVNPETGTAHHENTKKGKENAKRQLQEAKRRDVERIANVETCLSVMRHDVSPFIGYLRNPNLGEELRSEVLEQLLRTFDNIKSWTSLSIPSGLVFTPSVCSVQEVLEEVSRQAVSPAEGVELRFVPTEAQLWGDRLLVTILLRNLVNNALQHTHKGRVEVSAEGADGWVHLKVSDTGDGMTAEQQESLFSAARPQGDHGFGLILCRYIVKKHDDNTRRGCKIWVESTVGRGTTMHVMLAGSEITKD